MPRRMLCGVALCIALWTAAGLAEDSVELGKALPAAQQWLALVDQGRYGDSWNAAAGYFQEIVPQHQWEQSLQAVRTPLGRMLTRTVLRTKYATTLPGAPDGHYVIIQFKTSFEHKQSAIETVTPMIDKDGRWRISGYFIR